MIVVLGGGQLVLDHVSPEQTIFAAGPLTAIGQDLVATRVEQIALTLDLSYL